MAERRMIAKTIIGSDAFLEMPQSSQCLYFHLNSRGDDDGFVNNPRAIMREVGCREDDIKLLIVKKFIIPFDSGVIVIKHWRIHNLIQNDRYHETKYKTEKAMLELDENKSYRLKKEYLGNGSKVDPEVSIGKVSIDQLSSGSSNITSGEEPKQLPQPKFEPPKEYRPDPEFQKVVQCWTVNVTPLINVNSVVTDSFKEFIPLVGADVYILAIKESCKSLHPAKPNINYIETKLRDWIAFEANTPEKVVALLAQRQEQKDAAKAKSNLPSKPQEPKPPPRPKCLSDFEERERLAEELMKQNGVS